MLYNYIIKKKMEKAFKQKNMPLAQYYYKLLLANKDLEVSADALCK